jgi:hypothetical protein
MSIVGEIMEELNAKTNAKKLEAILLEAINGSTWSDVRSSIRAFSKYELYNWYLEECSNGHVEPNQEIVMNFEPNKITKEAKKSVCDLCNNGTPKQTGNMFVCPKCGEAIN